MWANSVWGFFGLGIALGLAVLSLPADFIWLRPWFAIGAAISSVLSVIVLVWPLRVAQNRAIVSLKIRHPVRWMTELIEPSHVIILGLAIALCGVVWQMREQRTVSTAEEKQVPQVMLASSGSPFRDAINAYLIKHGQPTGRADDGTIGMASAGPSDNYIAFWNTSILGPAPTVDDGFTASQLRALPNIPNLKTQTAKEDFQVALNDLSKIVRQADELLKISDPIAGNRPLIRKDLRGALDPLEKLQRARAIFNDMYGQLFAGGAAPFFNKYTPSYKKSLLSVLPENSQNTWEGYNSALYKLTLAITLVQDAERHQDDNAAYERTVKNAELLADEFRKTINPIHEWEDYAIKRLDLLANSI